MSLVVENQHFNSLKLVEIVIFYNLWHWSTSIRQTRMELLFLTRLALRETANPCGNTFVLFDLAYGNNVALIQGLYSTYTPGARGVAVFTESNYAKATYLRWTVVRMSRTLRVERYTANCVLRNALQIAYVRINVQCVVNNNLFPAIVEIFLNSQFFRIKRS